MLDVFRVADALVAFVQRDHPDEVDLIGYYGSYARGMAAPGSDLDIFFIPAEGKGAGIARAFLVEDKLFDFWGISWEKMEGFATGRARGWLFAPSIVHHAKVLYARSERESSRFNAIKQQVVSLQKPEAFPEMLARALDKFALVLAHLGNLRMALPGNDFADIRNEGWKVVLASLECLALANQVFFDKGYGSLMEQLPLLRNRPEGMEDCLVTIGTSREPAQIAVAAESLALGTRQVLRGLQATLPAKATLQETLGCAYPEIHDGINKILRACKEGKQVDAGALAWFWQYDLALWLEILRDGAGAHADFNLLSEGSTYYREIGLSDMISCDVSSSGLSGLAQQAVSLDRQVRQWLLGNSIGLCSYDSLEDFERSL